MRLLRPCFISYAILLLPAAVLRAETMPSAQEAAQLPAVMVTATAEAAASTVPTLEAAREAQRDVPGGASVIAAEEFRGGRVSTPEDALRQAPGVFIASRFGSEESRLSIRGSGLQRTFHGRGLLLLQDGVPLNLADGSFDFQAVEPLAAQYIEVLRGASAFRYGATTLGGAVQFVSPSGLDAAPEIRLEGGSFGYRRAYAQYTAANDSSDIFLSASHFGRDGFQHHSEQDTQRLFANAGHRFSDTLEQRVYLTLVRTESELPGALTEDEFRRGKTRVAAPGNMTGDQRRDFDLWRLAYKLSWLPAASQQLDFSTFYSGKSLFHPIFQVLEQDSDDIGADLRWSHDAPFAREQDRFVLGARVQQGRLDDDRFTNVGGAPDARTDKSEQDARSDVLYAEYAWSFAAQWQALAGLQWVSAQRRFEDYFVAGTPQDPVNKSFEENYRELLPRLGLIHDVGEQAQVFANVSGVYEPPSFGEMTGGPGVDMLDAQEGVSYEIGARGNWKKERMAAGWDVAVYQMDLDKELIAYQLEPSITRTVNADRTSHRGLELGLSLEVLANWQARFSYQFNDFVFDDDAIYGDNHIAGVPEQVLNAELGYRFRERKAYVTGLVTAASSSWVDHRNQLKAPGYAVYGLRLGQEVTPALSWFLEGRNLSDKVYAATHGVVIDATAPADQRLFNPGDGRAFYAGLSWTMR